MYGNYWPFSLILLTGLAITIPAHSQHVNKLIGCWAAIEPTEEDTFIIGDGHPIRFKGRPAITIALNFNPDNSASLTIKDGESIKILPFTYRIINSKLIESRYTNGGKPVQATFTIAKHKLWPAPYPIPKKPQESADILYTLTFIEQL